MSKGTKRLIEKRIKDFEEDRIGFQNETKLSQAFLS